MRIAFIAGEYPPLQGGLGDYTRELARALAMAGHEPHVLTKSVRGVPGEEFTSGIHVHRAIPHWDWTTLPYVSRFIRHYQPDVLNLQYQAAAYNMHGAINLLPRLLAGRTPMIITFHDLKVPYLFPKAGPLRTQAILDMAQHGAATIVTNVVDQATLAAAYVNKLFLIPIGSNITPTGLDRFDRAEWLRAHGISADTGVVGYFGFMNESKGGETLIRALAEAREQQLDVTLLLIGGQTGESDPTNVAYAKHIMQLADQLKVREHMVLTGYLDDQGVSESLAACDCMALPYRDGASFRRGTLMAALAHGCAVITTTPHHQISELRHAENALLVPPGDTHRLANAMMQVLRDTQLRARLRAGSLRLSMLFTWDRIAAETVTVFQHVLR
jgi:glycosyltransferase involved in cell wall biosynthesis